MNSMYQEHVITDSHMICVGGDTQMPRLLLCKGSYSWILLSDDSVGSLYFKLQVGKQGKIQQTSIKATLDML